MVTPFLSQIALELRLRRRRGHRGVRADLSRGRRAHRDAPALSRAGAPDPRGGEAAGRARQPLPAGARAVRRSAAGAVAAAAARRCRWCTPHEARTDSLDQLLSGLRRDRPRAGDACRPSWSPAPRPSSTICSPRASSQVSVVSAVEYARNAAAYHLLPDLAITCDGPVHSVALFSRRPVDGARRPHGAAHRVVPHLGAAARAALPPPLGACARSSPRPGPRRPISTRSPACRTTRCSSSATRRCCSRRAGARTRCGWTSARSGRRGPGCRSSSRSGRRGGTPALGRCGGASRGCSSRAPGDWRTWTSWPTRRAADDRASPSRSAARISGDLDYALSYRHLAGLTDFFRRLAQDGLVPDGSLSFISAA